MYVAISFYDFICTENFQICTYLPVYVSRGISINWIKIRPRLIVIRSKVKAGKMGHCYTIIMQFLYHFIIFLYHFMPI
jgi:hypothetical protein